MDTGFEPVYTALQAAASPLGQSTERHNTDNTRTVPERPDPRTGPTRADDEIRTRDPHLGKVMRYQLRYIRIPSRSSLRHVEDSIRSCGTRQNRLRPPGVSPGGPVSMCIRGPESASIESRSRSRMHGRLAQLVARFLHTEEVISSSLVSPTRVKPSVSRGFSSFQAEWISAQNPRTEKSNGKSNTLPSVGIEADVTAIRVRLPPASRSKYWVSRRVSHTVSSHPRVSNCHLSISALPLRQGVKRSTFVSRRTKPTDS